MASTPNYSADRVDDQINWYSEKATENKSRFHNLQIIIIIIAAAIPVINVIDFAPLETRIVSSIMGAVVVAIMGIIQLKKYHENWIMYRSTEEVLKKEKYKFENNAGEYSGLKDDEKLKLLVENVESFISSQNVVFFITQRKGSN